MMLGGSLRTSYRVFKKFFPSCARKEAVPAGRPKNRSLTVAARLSNGFLNTLLARLW